MINSQILSVSPDFVGQGRYLVSFEVTHLKRNLKFKGEVPVNVEPSFGNLLAPIHDTLLLQSLVPDNECRNHVIGAIKDAFIEMQSAPR